MQKHCDLCGKKDLPEIIDGNIRGSGWAYMCRECHRANGVGLGTGKGQLYDTKTGKKLAG